MLFGKVTKVYKIRCDHKLHKTLWVSEVCLPLLFVEGSTHFGSIISFSLASSEFSFITK